MSAKPTKTRSKKQKVSTSKAARAAMLCDAPRSQFPTVVGDTFPDGRPRWVYEAGLRGYGRFRIPHDVTEGMAIASWAAAEGLLDEWLSGSSGIAGKKASVELREALLNSWHTVIGAYVCAVPIGYLGTFATVAYDGRGDRN